MIAIAVVATGNAQAQTGKYIRVETTRFDKTGAVTAKQIYYKRGQVEVGQSFINIEGIKSLTIVTRGKAQAQDEGYTAYECVCISESKTGTLKALKCVLYYRPDKALCDVIIKTGRSNTDYCLTDK